MDTLAFVTAELQAKGTSIERLRRLLFGAPTEKTGEVLRKAGQPPAGRPQGQAEDKARAPGHGRTAAAAYTGASREKVAHASLHGGDACQGCLKGKVYPLKESAVRVRVQGMAPLVATVWECERLRCNLCGEVYTAQAPEAVGEEKYDETAVAMTGLLKYGTGLPFHRIEKLQAGLGIPLPATTQWELVEAGARKLQPAFDELVNQAAQAPVLHNDDTVMKVLALTREQVQAAAAGAPLERTGVFTSGLLAVHQEHPIALFFTGRQHAGENLADVLRQRAAELSAPIQMSDALAANAPGEFATLWANCLAHARRGFVDVATDFPAECTHVLEALREVYRVDAVARERGLTPAQRLALHQQESGPVLDGLKAWLDGAIHPAQGGAQLRAGPGHHLPAQALAEADPLPARGGRPTRQQRVRAGPQESHPPPKECPLLPDAEWRSRGRRLHESHPHRGAVRGQPLRLPGGAASPPGGGGGKPRASGCPGTTSRPWPRRTRRPRADSPRPPSLSRSAHLHCLAARHQRSTPVPSLLAPGGMLTHARRRDTTPWNSRNGSWPMWMDWSKEAPASPTGRCAPPWRKKTWSWRVSRRSRCSRPNLLPKTCVRFYAKQARRSVPRCCERWNCQLAPDWATSSFPCFTTVRQTSRPWCWKPWSSGRKPRSRNWPVTSHTRASSYSESHGVDSLTTPPPHGTANGARRSRRPCLQSRMKQTSMRV